MGILTLLTLIQQNGHPSAHQDYGALKTACDCWGKYEHNEDKV